ncbi:GlxA family transcriptional regulator [Pseudomonas eucalypticola]|uniref:Helix-turn-helix domain-containing protein n=1 Tax=Pseudomonas eucalypticola TaxID=2599595 RepID=A0A7D5D6D3_9PSED|nr:helix-turn-helix domain-containing protein [Pseudomonas eucalypticola]QKZ03973.1 helix-turn-helix domain-containing protein [Pseudomonas eucalypticola]
MTHVRTIAVVALPNVQLLDVSGPLDVFAEANREAGCERYRLLLVGCGSGPVTSSSGTRLLPETHTGHALAGIDTLLVAGAPNAPQARFSQALLDWLRLHAPQARRFGSVCTGAFALAAAGLLDGRRVTTHWVAAEALASRYPQVQVDADAIHVRDGKLRTAAGVTAGLDLALALVEEDLGEDIARRVASQLVMFFKRPGGQLQFSRKGESLPAGRSALQEVQRYVAAHPAEDHSIKALAARAGLSPRHFARLFHQEVGETPASWVEQARIQAARERLEQGHETPKQVAAHCGFANADTLRRAFSKAVGVSPAEYRKRFAGRGGNV